MNKVQLSSDIIRYLAVLLNPKDLLHVGMTCKKFKREIYYNVKLWKHHVISRYLGNINTIGIGEHDFNWKHLAFSSPKNVQAKIKAFHLHQRLSTKPEDKNFLRFYCKISTVAMASIDVRHTQVEHPDQIMCCEVLGQLDCKNVSGSMLYFSDYFYARDQPRDQAAIGGTTNLVYITFKHSKGNVLFFNGENNVHSALVVYAVDRTRMGESNILPIPVVGATIHRTTLSKTQYETIGKIARNNANYYTNTGGVSLPSYNQSSEHGRFRDLGSISDRYCFGANSKSSGFDRPNVAVSAWTHVTCAFKLETLYTLFCSVKQFSDGPVKM